MLRVIEQTPQRVELLIKSEILQSSSYTEKDIQLICRVSQSKLLKVKLNSYLSVYNTDKKCELVFYKKKIERNVHHLELVKITAKELLINEGLFTFHPSYSK